MGFKKISFNFSFMCLCYCTPHAHGCWPPLDSLRVDMTEVCGLPVWVFGSSGRAVSTITIEPSLQMAFNKPFGPL